MLRMDPKRKWLHIIHEIQPKTIIEIGVAKGRSAISLLSIAFDYHNEITYDGYDLFDLATDENDEKEHNGKTVQSVDFVKARLNRFNGKGSKRLTMNFHRGFTTDTLIEPVIADFVYIDGGHSYETVKHDYSMVKDSKCVVFDDYHIPSVKQFVDELTDEHDLRFLDEPGLRHMAKVMLVKK